MFQFFDQTEVSCSPGSSRNGGNAGYEFRGTTMNMKSLFFFRRTKEHPLTKCLHAYQFEIHQQLTTLCEQAQELLMHITNAGNVQCQRNQETTQENITSEHQDEQKEISDEEKDSVLDDELADVLDNDEPNERTALPETNNSEEVTKDSQVDSELLSAQKENEYKTVLESVVKKVQFSLGTYMSNVQRQIFGAFSSDRQCNKTLRFFT